MQYVLFLSILTIVSSAFASVEPDITNKNEILALAELSANAYLYPNTRNASSWRNSTKMYNYEYSYGWDVDGLRGHVFKKVDAPVITIAVKGTSLNSQKDKESANLICSCNCCFSKCTNKCDRKRLMESLPNMYLSLLLIAVERVKERYRDHAIWFTGHSMGSVVAALAAVKTCNHAIGFSAPGEQLFANRINLTHNCGDNHKRTIHHFGYYKDPIFIGNCGWWCTAAGYRIDSKCHHGNECVYLDPPKIDKLVYENEQSYYSNKQLHELGSGMIYKHTINFLIDKIIIPNQDVPQCIPVTNCTETCKDDNEDDDNMIKQILYM